MFCNYNYSNRVHADEMIMIAIGVYDDKIQLLLHAIKIELLSAILRDSHIPQ
jgi:hypothetical protein